MALPIPSGYQVVAPGTPGALLTADGQLIGKIPSQPTQSQGSTSTYVGSNLIPVPSNLYAGTVDPMQGQVYYDPSTGSYTGKNGVITSPFFLQNPNTQKWVQGLYSPQQSATYVNQQAPAPNPNAPLPQQMALQDLSKIDPQTAALRTQVGSTYGPALTSASNLLESQQDQYNLGSQLDPNMIRETQQYARGAQAARGNDAGVAQAVQEGMTLGSAGQALRQQRLSNLSGAQTGQLNALGGTTNWLGSGQTNLGASQTYLNNALNQQSAAMTGTPVYSPSQTPPAYQFLDPNAGQSFAQGTQGFMQQGVGAKPGSPDTSGQYIGAGIGAVGAIAAASIMAFCQVAREVYGATDPRWIKFRDWVLFSAPGWFRTLYANYALRVSRWIKDKPLIKGLLRIVMDRVTA